ncbi:MAG: restriction endonuclease [Dehalococcoidia bacterium]
MAFPKDSELQTAILEEVAAAGGRVKPSTIYEKVVSRFNLTPEDRAIFYAGDQRTPKWVKLQQWARQALVQKGELDPKVKGEWVITPKGLARIGRAATAPAPAAKQAPPPAPPPPAVTPEVTPTIARLAADQETTVREALLTHIYQLSPAEFEQLVGRVLEAMGFPQVTVTGRTGDGGVDGECEMPLLDLKAAFQAKRYTTNSVGGPLMAQFRGQITGRFDRGIYITASTFTQGAREMAEQPGGVKIILIDGEGLVDLMMKHSLGVRSEPLALKQIDETFFARLSSQD